MYKLHDHTSLRSLDPVEYIPSLGRCQGSRESRQQSKSKSHGNRGRTEDGDDRSLLDQPYPIKPTRRVSHQPPHRQRSFRRRWVRIPKEPSLAKEHQRLLPTNLLLIETVIRWNNDLLSKAIECLRQVRLGDEMLTSGKVPLEKTLSRRNGISYHSLSEWMITIRVD